MTDWRNTIGYLRGGILLVCVALIVLIAGREFQAMHVDEPLYPSPSLAETRMLSDYVPALKGSRGDTELYFFDSGKPGGTCLILGGTHPNEPAAFLTAYLLVENLSMEAGRVIVLPRSNRSAFTHNEASEGHPTFFDLPTPAGPRRFRYGCRFTNFLDQWPDPEVYLHYPSKQELSGTETRNLNRAYPGRLNGNFTERVAHAVTTVVRQENVDLVIDLHEAALEYPVIDAIVAHERAMDVAAMANLMLQAQGLTYALEPSPVNFHGLTHREIGDATDAMVVLMESANVIQGRLRGRTTPELVLTGLDPCYVKASAAGMVRVPYDSTGIPLEVRVGRHLAGIQALFDGLAMLHPEKAITLSGLPGYSDVLEQGVGAYLTPGGLEKRKSIQGEKE